MDYRIKALLKEIEYLLHASNEDIYLAVKYRPVILYDIALVKRYRRETER